MTPAAAFVLKTQQPYTGDNDMAVLVQNFAKVSGLALIQQLCSSFASKLEKNTVPHWCDYLNEK